MIPSVDEALVTAEQKKDETLLKVLNRHKQMALQQYSQSLDFRFPSLSDRDNQDNS